MCVHYYNAMRTDRIPCTPPRSLTYAQKTSLQFQSVLLCSSAVVYCKRIYRHNGNEEHTSKRTLPSLFTVHQLSLVFMSNFSLSVLTAHSLTTQRQATNVIPTRLVRRFSSIRLGRHFLRNALDLN